MRLLLGASGLCVWVSIPADSKQQIELFKKNVTTLELQVDGKLREGKGQFTGHLLVRVRESLYNSFSKEVLVHSFLVFCPLSTVLVYALHWTEEAFSFPHYRNSCHIGGIGFESWVLKLRHVHGVQILLLQVCFISLNAHRFNYTILNKKTPQ